MKRWMFLVALLSSFLLSSCIYEPGPMGPMGPQGPQGPAGPGMNWSVKWITIQQEDWKPVYPMGDTYYEYRINGEFMADLTRFVAREGTVEMYIYTDPEHIIENPDGSLEGKQAPLPYTRFYRTDEGKEYTMTYDFEFVKGEIIVESRYSDFAKVSPPTVTFRVVLQW